MDRASAEVQDAIEQAVSGISSDFDLRDLLVGVVRAACTLSGARYGALGVIGHTRRQLVEFVTEGVNDEERARIGPSPIGRGLLGHLIDHPESLRIDDLRTHPASTGFPPAHPPMTTFLGVPVRVSGRVFGNLYLTDKTTGSTFTADDEKAVVAIAHLAGIAIEHANLLVMTEHRARWLEATALMPADVLRAHLPQNALEAVLHGALDAAQGLTAIAIAPASAGQFTVRAAVGDLSTDPSTTLQTLRPTLMLAMATSSTRWIDLPVGGAVMTRLVIDTLTRGALIIVLPQGGFAENVADDSEFITNYASQASLALEKHHARTIHEQLAVLAERNRIARDLHDVIIQRLFALGLQLKTISSAVEPGIADRLHEVIDDLDATIGEIRRSIVDLRPTHQQRSIRAKIHGLVTEYSHVLGYAPALTITGPLDTLLDPALHHHVIAVLREGLSNSARHASATKVWLAIEVTPAQLTCTVTDDGTGPEQPGLRSGLRNLAERAAELGGTLQIASRSPRGCTLTWTVPLSGVA
ncbi:GAF domain-containing sensor histidine kinase [Sanguibacter gelidistatuariae]|uniref:GAF domain-containing sensor histidine kinase n=1 Tax=Sanguibacter gelidistatuariae TaxID=1814289 RepID=UPI00158814B0|nr:GAF domain-containing protein [Sanguibacter gelidistatuariae]